MSLSGGTIPTGGSQSLSASIQRGASGEKRACCVENSGCNRTVILVQCVTHTLNKYGHIAIYNLAQIWMHGNNRRAYAHDSVNRMNCLPDIPSIMANVHSKQLCAALYMNIKQLGLIWDNYIGPYLVDRCLDQSCLLYKSMNTIIVHACFPIRDPLVSCLLRVRYGANDATFQATAAKGGGNRSLCTVSRARAGYRTKLLLVVILFTVFWEDLLFGFRCSLAASVLFRFGQVGQRRRSMPHPSRRTRPFCGDIVREKALPSIFKRGPPNAIVIPSSQTESVSCNKN